MPAVRKSRASVRASALIACLVAALPLYAQKPGVDLRASGWAAASVYVQPSGDAALAAVGLRGGLTLDGYAWDALGFRLNLEAYSNLAGLADAAHWKLSLPYPLAFSVSGNDRLEAVLDLKEAWFDISFGAFDLRVGKQILAWGLADGNNPTDNLNARYIGTRFVSTLDEQKMGALAANLVYNLPGNRGTLQGVFLPISTPNDMASIAMDKLEPSIIRIIIEEDKVPAVEPGNVEGGLRALFYAGSLSFSASWFTYLDLYPDFIVVSSFDIINSVPLLTLTPFHSRVQQFGLDAAWLVGGFDLRGEWALTLTADAAGDDPALRNSRLNGVLQASRSFLDGALTATASWAPQFVLNHKAASPGGPDTADMLAEYNGQAYAAEQFAGLRLAGKFLGETLQPEAMILAGLSARDWMGSASVSYNFADGINGKAGFRAYGSFRSAGDPEREWGVFSNSRVIDSDSLYLELRLSL